MTTQQTHNTIIEGHNDREAVIISFYIYKAEGDFKTLYIGRTINLRKRLVTHRKTSPWWKETKHIEIAQVLNETHMKVIETLLINEIGPEYNKRDARNDDVSWFDYPPIEWEKFSPELF